MNPLIKERLKDLQKTIKHELEAIEQEAKLICEDCDVEVDTTEQYSRKFIDALIQEIIDNNGERLFLEYTSCELKGLFTKMQKLHYSCAILVKYFDFSE